MILLAHSIGKGPEVIDVWTTWTILNMVTEKRTIVLSGILINERQLLIRITNSWGGWAIVFRNLTKFMIFLWGAGPDFKTNSASLTNGQMDN